MIIFCCNIFSVDIWPFFKSFDYFISGKMIEMLLRRFFDAIFWWFEKVGRASEFLTYEHLLLNFMTRILRSSLLHHQHSSSKGSVPRSSPEHALSVVLPHSTYKQKWGSLWFQKQTRQPTTVFKTHKVIWSYNSKSQWRTKKYKKHYTSVIWQDLILIWFLRTENRFDIEQ